MLFDIAKIETYLVMNLFYRNVSDVAQRPLISFLRLIAQNILINDQNLPPYLEFQITLRLLCFEIMKS